GSADLAQRLKDCGLDPDSAIAQKWSEIADKIIKQYFMTCRQNLSLKDGTMYSEKVYAFNILHPTLAGVEGTGAND
ncbi:MAG TPA: hypothetical protein PLV12_03380, partial [Saprospiraceae bacterium]|nr:hypothetical protein [Saprospiraceae bacterium]